MSLSNALQIGRSGLMASSVAIETTGNNLANVATRGYHRQTITLAPENVRQVQSGTFVGRGVKVAEITRVINEALEARLRGSVSDQSRTAVRQGVLEQLEAIENELSGLDLSTQLSRFFSAFSDLANNPQDMSLRTLAVLQAETLAQDVARLHTGYTNLRTQIDKSLGAGAVAANDLLTRIEQVTMQIVTAEGSRGGAAGLRDERDQMLGELSRYLDISVNEHGNGGIDIFVSSLPIMLNGQSRGVEQRTRTIDGQTLTDIVISANKDPLNIASGELGALIAAQRVDVQDAIDAIDQFAASLIFEVNKLHTQGQGLSGYSSVTGTTALVDTTLPLNDPLSGVPLAPSHGSFLLHVTQKSTGQQITTRIDVDLDDIDPANNTSLSSLAAAINAVGDVSASINGARQLVISADAADYEISFSEDSSGVLASLGIHSLFTGSRAADIGVNAMIKQSPSLLAAAQGHLPGDNRNALAIATLRDTALADTGMSITQLWSRHVEDFAIRHSQAKTQLQADSIVRENLEAQQQAVSGVNPDEESINLLAYQRAFQGSARFLSVVDELMATLLNMV